MGTLPQARLLHDGWRAKHHGEVASGEELTAGPLPTDGLEATVPGTVLTMLVANGKYPDPYFDLNNDCIPDASEKRRSDASKKCSPDASEGGVDHYTYYFYTSFDLPAKVAGQRLWLTFRGINYKADVFLNGEKLRSDLEGMFRHHDIEITDRAVAGTNRLAVLVYPPYPAGIYEGPGDGTNGGVQDCTNLAHSVTMRYPVGWDWTQPVRDRNTGIWDQVLLRTTGPVQLQHPHVVCKVLADGKLSGKAKIDVSVEAPSPSGVSGQLRAVATRVDNDAGLRRIDFEVDGHDPLRLSAVVENPPLWWPRGLGEQPLYELTIDYVLEDGSVSDSITTRFGIREVDVLGPGKFDDLNSRVFRVNGQEVFLRGGNWIGTDAMLRLSSQRYDDEVRMHAEMNLNLIRVWGGGIAERPEFYDACDRHGILVMQDFWQSGECQPDYGNGLGKVFLDSARDTIRMLRNHPSLLLWCGGNELYLQEKSARRLTANLEECVRKEDGTRPFIDQSTNLDGHDNRQYADGPYYMIDPKAFYETGSTHFNPEIGYVGVPTADSVRLMMIAEHAGSFPKKAQNKSDRFDGTKTGPTWIRHCYANYCCHVDENEPCPGDCDALYAYGDPQSLDEFCDQAQLVNYVEYRALFEGAASQMWTNYAGIMVWKSQGPWPALLSQLYDYYLQQTGGYYGARKACEPLHVQLDLRNNTVCVVNTTLESVEGLTASATVFGPHGRLVKREQEHVSAPSMNIKPDVLAVDLPQDHGPYFVKLELHSARGSLKSRNVYWLGGEAKLRSLPAARLEGKAHKAPSSSDLVRIEASVLNQGDPSLDPVAFAVRLQATHPTGERIVPVWYSDNYMCIVPGDEETVTVDIPTRLLDGAEPELRLTGWNTNEVRLWPS